MGHRFESCRARLFLYMLAIISSSVLLQSCCGVICRICCCCGSNECGRLASSSPTTSGEPAWQTAASAFQSGDFEPFPAVLARLSRVGVDTCALCSYYLPTGSSQAQLVEGKANLLRMQQEIPLTEEERSAVDDGIEAFERLLQKLEGAPRPAQLMLNHKQTPTRSLPVLPSSMSTSSESNTPSSRTLSKQKQF